MSFESVLLPSGYRTHRLFAGENKTLILSLENEQEVTIEVHEGKMKNYVAPEQLFWLIR